MASLAVTKLTLAPGLAATPIAAAPPSRLALGLALWLAGALTGHASLARAQQSSGGFEVAADLVHGAYRIPGAPNVIVHAAAGFDPRQPLELVVFLHGYSACVRALMGSGDTACKPRDVLRPGWDLGRYHDAAHVNTLFVVPQLAYLKRDGHPGAFGREGGFRAFLEELLRGPLAELLGGARSVRDIARIDVVAHSGGYRAALAVLEHGGLAPSLVRSVVLFDALYGETPSFARYVEGRSRATGKVRAPGALSSPFPFQFQFQFQFQFVVVSLPYGPPSRESRALCQRLMRSLGPAFVTTADATQIASAIATHPIVIALGSPPHRLVPATYLAEVLGALHRADTRP